VLILVSSSNEGPVLKQLSALSEVAINGCTSVILGVDRTVMGVLIVSFFLLEGRL